MKDDEKLGVRAHNIAIFDGGRSLFGENTPESRNAARLHWCDCGQRNWEANEESMWAAEEMNYRKLVVDKDREQLYMEAGQRLRMYSPTLWQRVLVGLRRLWLR